MGSVVALNNNTVNNNVVAVQPKAYATVGDMNISGSAQFIGCTPQTIQGKIKNKMLDVTVSNDGEKVVSGESLERLYRGSLFRTHKHEKYQVAEPLSVDCAVEFYLEACQKHDVRVPPFVQKKIVERLDNLLNEMKRFDMNEAIQYRVDLLKRFVRVL